MEVGMENLQSVARVSDYNIIISCFALAQLLLSIHFPQKPFALTLIIHNTAKSKLADTTLHLRPTTPAMTDTKYTVYRTESVTAMAAGMEKYQFVARVSDPLNLRTSSDVSKHT